MAMRRIDIIRDLTVLRARDTQPPWLTERSGEEIGIITKLARDKKYHMAADIVLGVTRTTSKPTVQKKPVVTVKATTKKVTKKVTKKKTSRR